MPLVEARDLHKRYGPREVLRGVDLTVAPGEVVVLVGPSGCGKSTLLRCIDGLTLPTSGTLTVCGLPVRDDPRTLLALRRRVGMVFQQLNLFPHLSVLDNVTLAPRKVLRMPREAAEAEARRLLDEVRLGERADAFPGQLSGGQQQRVAIVRALALRPELMLFDEPTSALDPELVGEVMEVMRGLARRGMTMCVVTHELAFAEDVAHRVLFLDGGRVVEQGPPAELLHHPREPRTRAFLHRLPRR